jgi:activating signal cointegrator 1
VVTTDSVARADTIVGLVVRQPWASMIAVGEKSIEVRTWRTRHRGPLLICAAARDADEGGEDLPRGVPVCVVDVVDCRPMTPADEQPACSAWGPGYWAWVLARPRRAPSINVRGGQKLFRVKLPAGVAGAAR